VYFGHSCSPHAYTRLRLVATVSCRVAATSTAATLSTQGAPCSCLPPLQAAPPPPYMWCLLPATSTACQEQKQQLWAPAGHRHDTWRTSPTPPQGAMHNATARRCSGDVVHWCSAGTLVQCWHTGAVLVPALPHNKHRRVHTCCQPDNGTASAMSPSAHTSWPHVSFHLSPGLARHHMQAVCCAVNTGIHGMAAVQTTCHVGCSQV
jgi:hypothetical protein